MKITVKFTPYMSTLTKTDQTVVELDENAHLSDLLKILTARYGEALMNLLFVSELSSIDVWPSIIVEGQVVSLPLVPSFDVGLKDGSVIVLFAPASGG